MSVKNYVVSIVISAVIVAIASSLLKKKTAIGAVAHLIGGILLAVAILSPFMHISFRGISDYLDDLNMESQRYIADGEKASAEFASDIIKSRTEAYILDKANRLGLQIGVEVELDAEKNSIPCGVVFIGSVSPYAKEILCAYVEDNLGIERENQKWKQN